MVAGVQHAVTTTLARCHCARSLGAASQDTDGNGEVTFVEFKVWWDENGGALPPPTTRQGQSEPGRDALSVIAGGKWPHRLRRLPVAMGTFWCELTMSCFRDRPLCKAPLRNLPIPTPREQGKVAPLAKAG